ncbi:flagellin [Halorientalis halophila]|uniref:flagellin n=1 Tax=Halorientalis halophila TaxID=3108499 RepID=UPI0030087F00
MGVSVSTSLAVVLIGGFIAFGVFTTAATNSFERVSDATGAQNERFDRVQGTSIDVTHASIVATVPDCILQVNVTNRGESRLSVAETDVLVDGEYATDWDNDTSVDGDEDTDVWLPAERLTLNVTVDQTPGRVKVVSGTGVAATGPVTEGLTC